DSSLSSALSKLSSSHDAAFIFNEDGSYVGVVNPYYTVIKSSLPGTTKVENCAFHPPRIYENDSLERIAQQMTESKIHYLPVFDDNQNFIGITSGRRILKEIQQLPIAKTTVLEVSEARNGGIVSVYDNDTINTAMNLFKEHKISKLIVIDKNMKLQGILSYYDLTPYLIASGRGKNQEKLLNIHERNHFLQMKVKGYAKKTVLTVNPDTTVADAISEMITRGMGSVIITDGESNPVGIVTTKDIFNLLKPNTIKKAFQLITKDISSQNEKVISDFSDYVSALIQKYADIKSAKLLVDEEKNGILFKISVYLTPHKGKQIVIAKEGKNIHDMIKEVKQALHSKLTE
ncbi:MAG TPA: CBS domain-containing protein, partial [Candidatus Woesebacteria bacterium]|nr:CBS domain-containing protein [Candidatus Woesebacteria bacterium]